MSDLKLMDLPVWRVRHVAQYLQVSPRTIYNKVSLGTIPYHKRKGSRFPYFLPEEIENWVLEG